MNVELEKNRKPRDSGDCRSRLGREFFPCGAAVWIPAAFFVLLVLFQMVPLPMGVLKVVSPATYELYEKTGFRVQGSPRLNPPPGCSCRSNSTGQGGSGGVFLLTGMGL